MSRLSAGSEHDLRLRDFEKGSRGSARLGGAVAVRSGGEASYVFFLSYAHTPEQGWVKRLFQDLSNEILERTTFPLGPVGFMDSSAIPLGSDWRDEVWGALANCRVFVPLYSPRYFTREECGKEWHAFAQRQLDHRAHNHADTSAIVPALWTPVRPDDLPDVARRIQANQASFGPVYTEEGLYTLIKNSTYQHEYVSAVQRLAQRIIEVAERSRLEPCDPRSLGQPRNVFETTGRRAAADRRLTIIVAAPTTAQLPARRDAVYYGSSCLAWNPYHPHSRQSLADYAAGVARLHSYEPAVLTLDQGLAFARLRDPAAGLGLLLLDPWAGQDSELSDQLRQFDALGVEWVEAMLPWNDTDVQTVQERQPLRARLRELLPNRLGGGQLIGAANGVRVGSLEEFRLTFNDVVEHAMRRFINHADAHPPDGPLDFLPRLAGPREPQDQRTANEGGPS